MQVKILIFILIFDLGVSYRVSLLEPQLEDSTFKYNAEVTEEDNADVSGYLDEMRVKNRLKKSAKVWDHWGKWSPCTVSCGEGKMMRWRHCVSQACAPGEKEAQIKTCKKPHC